MPRVLADGKTKFTILTTAPANPAAPTAAELNAGIDLSCKVLSEGFEFGPTDSETVDEAALCDEGAKLISQHSDNATPATAAQSKGVFHTGYNNDMTGVAPEASLLSTRIDWSPYFVYAIEAVANGETFAKDWTGGWADGAVVLSELNEAIAAPGTAEKLAEVEKGIVDGSIQPFAGPFTGTGMAYGASAADTLTVADGEFYKESDVAGGKTSAPSFYWIIEGITEG